MISEGAARWMGAPDSAIKDGHRWGFQKFQPQVVDGKRLQVIGDKTIWHEVKRGKAHHQNEKLDA